MKLTLQFNFFSHFSAFETYMCLIFSVTQSLSVRCYWLHSCHYLNFKMPPLVSTGYGVAGDNHRALVAPRDKLVGRGEIKVVSQMGGQFLMWKLKEGKL